NMRNRVCVTFESVPAASGVMKSDTTTVIARCAVTRAMNSNAFTRFVPRRFGSKNSTSRMTRRTWLRPLRGGMNFSTSSLKRMRPTLSLLRMAEEASTEAISAASARLDWPREPNRPEPLTSTTSMSVSSRSSTNFLMNGWFIRAVTFQSIARTSSPGWYSRTSSKFMPWPLKTEWYWPASVSVTMRFVRSSICRIFLRISRGIMRKLFFFRARQCLQIRRGQNLHLTNGNLVQPFQPFALRQSHVNKFGVHALHVGENKQLLDAGVIADVAFQLGIGVTPLPRGMTEKCNIEQIRFGRVSNGRLCERDFGWNQVRL